MDTNEKDLPPAVRVLNDNGASPIVLVCEHASAFIPLRYAGLGLSATDLKRHIAWDIGAADVARRLAGLIDAPLVLAGYSRLLIDLNRPPGSMTSVPGISETTVIPGNFNLTDEERRHRTDTYFTPFQQRRSALLDERQHEGRVSAVIGIHSFTPVYKGFARPWHGGILFRYAKHLGMKLVAALGGEAANIAANEPYRIGDDSDYTVPVHGEARGLDCVLVEMRQDLIADGAGAELWAQRLGVALRESVMA